MFQAMRDKFSKKAVLLPVIMITLTVFACGAIAMIGYMSGQEGLRNATSAELSTLANSRAQLLDSRLSSAISDLDAISSGTAVATIINDVGPFLETLAIDLPKVLEYFQGPATPAERAALTGEGVSTMYTYRHNELHNGLLTSWKNGKYGDIYVLNNVGDVIYSVTKSSDFLAKAADPENAQSPLTEVFKKINGAPSGMRVASNFVPYAANDGVPAIFLAQSIWLEAQGEESFKGVVVIRLDAKYFDSVLSSTDGLGETGQTFLANPEGLVISNMPRSAEPTALSTQLDYTPIMTATKEGKTAIGAAHHEDGTQMLVAATPLSLFDKRWAVVAERTEFESMGAVRKMASGLFWGSLAVVAVAGAIAILVSRFITKPITRLTQIMRELADGDLDVEVRGAEGRDEIGDMARAVQIFRENGIKVLSMTEEETIAEEKRRVERVEMMQTLQSSFGEVVDAAIAGDFSKRVDAQFADEELNNLASGVNTLVETVDGGLKETGVVLASLADTDLTNRVQGDYQGAFAQLQANTNAVADRLVDVVGQLRETSRGVKTATGEILSGANDLSERTTKQAATIEETSATMEQLATTVLENTKKAEDASSSAEAVSHTAEDGAQVMAQATDAMERITSSSSKISNIIGMIDDIAFQTNLLALNASVEAARAGEAGKGFAVVAVEVRRLAQSAAEASNDVKKLIEQSSNEVGEGSKLVAEAASKLESMLEAARTSNELMEGIAQESREQAASIEEVNAAVRQLDEMTQHNAALVEQTNAAIEQTEAQASELDRIVEIFKLDDKAAAKPRLVETGIKGLQQKVVTAAKTYLHGGNNTAAVQDDWSEF